MHDPGGVRGRQRLGGLNPNQARRMVEAQWAVALDQAAERDAVDVLHHQPLLGTVSDQVEDRHDVRVVQGRREARLARSALDVGVAATREHAHALHRDETAQDLVASEPDDAHAATPDLTLERVPACDHWFSLPAMPLGAS